LTIFVAIITLLAILYLLSRAEKLQAGVTTIEKALATEPTETAAIPPIGFEWYEDGWPDWIVESADWYRSPLLPFSNPQPFEFVDEYSSSLLLAEFNATPAGLGRKSLLKSFYRTRGDYFPIALADAAASDADVVVRIWSASHMNLVYKDWNWESKEDINSRSTLRDYGKLFCSDPSPIVRAALCSNPKYDGTYSADMSQLERLALMRAPNTGGALLASLMESESDGIGMTRYEHVEVLCAAVLNPALIQNSRIYGRHYFVRFGDPNKPREEYAKLWNLTADHWLNTPVSYLVFKFIQTTPEVKLAMYQRLSEHCGHREAILRGCDPALDQAILKLGLTDSDAGCRITATAQCGEYRAFILKSK
jgi:hypothetical protein